MREIRGRITREQTVWCWCGLNHDHPLAEAIAKERRKILESPGFVGNWECEQHHSEAGPVADKARRIGWQNTLRRGWLCPVCIAALKKIPAGRLLALAYPECERCKGNGCVHCQGD